MIGSNCAALIAGKIETNIVVKIEQIEIKIIDPIFISDGIVLKK